jgi:hypothetical protein
MRTELAYINDRSRFCLPCYLPFGALPKTTLKFGLSGGAMVVPPTNADVRFQRSQ